MDENLNRNHSWQFHFLYISFVFNLVYIFGLGLNLELNFFIQVLLVSIGSSLVKFFLLNPLILYSLLALSLLGSFLINRYITSFVFTFVERTYFLFENIIHNLQGKENVASDNIFLFWGLLIIIFSFFTAFILFKGKSIYWLLPVYISFFLYYWYTFFNEAYWMAALFLLSFFIFIGLDKYSLEEPNNPFPRTIIIYSLLIVSTSILLPKINTYIQWPSLDQKIYKTFPIVKDLRSHHNSGPITGKAILFNFCITGFQTQSCKLGGPVVLNEDKVMSVYAENPNYLRGNVRHRYKGDSWCSKEVPWEGHIVNQNLSKLSEEERDLYYKNSNIKITNHAFASTTLFSPYLPTKISIPGNHPIHKSFDSVLVLKKGIHNGESYEVEVEKPLPYEVLVSLDIDRKKEDIELLNIYLQIPNDKITDRTRNLVKEIVKDAESDFEKAIAIENYLRNNYGYSLDVSIVPENEEFIDYFLFEEQKGYCTYFATTMALMLRLEGVPSRYIEGYLAQDQIKKGVYEVKQSNAHAWVEGFIEPVGWMTFEATPEFPVEARLKDHESTSLDSDSISEIYNENNMSLDRFTDDSIMYSDKEFLGGEYEINKSTSSNHPLKPVVDTILNLLKFLILMISIRFLISFFKYEYKKKRVNKLSNKDQILYLYEETLNLMTLLGHPQMPGETHFEYANRVAYKFSRFKEKGIIEITEIFVKSKYSNEPTLDEDLSDLEIYRKSLEYNLKNKLGRIRYFYNKHMKFKL